MPSRFWKASGNALLPSRNTFSTGGAAFTPASVPGLDFWIEADATKLFKDSGGTTPVSVDGDAIALAKDKSSAARDATDGGVSSQRALYKTDLSKPSIKFDGVDDLLSSATGLSWSDGSGQMWFAISLQSDATTQREIVALVNGGTYIADVYINTQAHMEINGSSGFEEDATAASTIAANTPVVIIGTVKSTQVEALVDNVSNGATNLIGTPSTSTGSMVIGNHSSAWAGRIFGVCHGAGTLSSSDRASLQTYMAGLHP